MLFLLKCQIQIKPIWSNVHYENQNEQPTQGTTVQCVIVSLPNKKGKKEPVKFIKATRGEKLI